LTGLFVLALPLGIVSGLNSLSTQVPRYIMERFAGQRELGIFAAIVSLGMVADLAITALSRSALPRLAQLYAQGAVRSFVRLLLRLMGIGAVLGALGVIGAALLGEPLLRIVYAEEYAAYQNVLIVVMVSIDVMTTFTFLGTAVTAAQQFAVQVLAQVAKVTAIGLACWVLIPRLGALGAAWGALVGALVSSLLYFVILWRTMRRTRARACYTLLNLTS
jgi:O-antigen/teichoic acid export membrane protein